MTEFHSREVISTNSNSDERLSSQSQTYQPDVNLFPLPKDLEAIRKTQKLEKKLQSRAFGPEFSFEISSEQRRKQALKRAEDFAEKHRQRGKDAARALKRNIQKPEDIVQEISVKEYQLECDERLQAGTNLGSLSQQLVRIKEQNIYELSFQLLTNGLEINTMQEGIKELVRITDVGGCQEEDFTLYRKLGQVMDSGILHKLKEIVDFEVDESGNFFRIDELHGFISQSQTLKKDMNSDRDATVQQLIDLKFEIAKLIFNFSFGTKLQQSGVRNCGILLSLLKRIRKIQSETNSQKLIQLSIATLANFVAENQKSKNVLLRESLFHALDDASQIFADDENMQLDIIFCVRNSLRSYPLNQITLETLPLILPGIRLAFRLLTLQFTDQLPYQANLQPNWTRNQVNEALKNCLLSILSIAACNKKLYEELSIQFKYHEALVKIITYIDDDIEVLNLALNHIALLTSFKKSTHSYIFCALSITTPLASLLLKSHHSLVSVTSASDADLSRRLLAETCACIGNLVYEPDSATQQIIHESGLMDQTCVKLYFEAQDISVKYQLLYCISNYSICKGRSFSMMLTMLFQQGVLGVIVDALFQATNQMQHKITIQSKMANIALSVLNKILKLFDLMQKSSFQLLGDDSKLIEKQKEEMLVLFETYGGVDHLETLQLHSDPRIFRKAQEILLQYFEQEQTFDEMVDCMFS